MSRIGCDEAMAHMQDYLKRELTPDLVVEMRYHLERCQYCQGCSRFEESFFLMLETRARRETCPHELRARILAALRAEARDH
jgi:anti-sigma factor (TIGR02949 family)